MNPLLDSAKPRHRPMDHYFSVAHRAGPTDETLEFGRFRVLLRQRRLLADGEPVQLGTRAFDILMVLLEADGALVTKDELLRLVWPDVVVCPDNLRVQIVALRKALGEDRELVQTEHGRGYRFTGAVNRLGPVVTRDAGGPVITGVIQAAPGGGPSVPGRPVLISPRGYWTRRAECPLARTTPAKPRKGSVRPPTRWARLFRLFRCGFGGEVRFGSCVTNAPSACSGAELYER